MAQIEEYLKETFLNAFSDFAASSQIYYRQQQEQKQQPCSELGYIQFVAGVVCDEIINSKTNTKVRFSAQDKQRLINQVTAIYLGCWLENDKEFEQTLHSFVAKKFVPRSKQKRGEMDTPEESEMKRYQRRENVLREMMLLREKQAEKEKMSYKALPPKNNSRGYYDFCTLYFLYMLSKKEEGEKWLLLFDLLIGKKKLLDVTHEKGSNYSLLLACNYYIGFFTHAEKLPDTKEYVVANIVAYKIETAFRFSLAMKIADYMVGHGAEHVDFMAHPFWARYRESMFVEDPGAPIEALDILSYESLIPYAVSFDINTLDGNTLDKNAKDAIEKATVQTIWRETLTATLFQVIALLPPHKQPHWKSDDFVSAAKFFRNEFNIIEALKPTLSHKIDSNFCERLRSLYEQLNKEKVPEYLRGLMNIDEMPLFGFRRDMQQARKKQNLRKTTAGG